MRDTPEVNECQKCKAPFWYFTSVNTRVYECGSENFQIQSKACKYATRLREELNAANAQIKELQATIQKLYKGAFEQQQRIENIIQAGDKLYSSIYCGCGVDGICKTCEQSTDLWECIKEFNA